MTIAPPHTEQHTGTVAIVGNPNTGKSTLFNALTGMTQRTGNYPGVTVEKKCGTMFVARGHGRATVVDLPGAYGLGARSRDEAVVLDVLMGRASGVAKPDLIINIVDASNLSRNLFLTSQLLELDMPLVVVLNMIDVAEDIGVSIDMDALSQQIGAPVVGIVASKQEGLDALLREVSGAFRSPGNDRRLAFPACVEAELEGLRESLAAHHAPESAEPSRFEALQVLLDAGGYHEQRSIADHGRDLLGELADRRRRIADHGESLVEVEARVRYAWSDDILGRTVRRAESRGVSRTQRADAVLTHRIWGLLLFIVLMGACFQSIYAWAGPLMDAIDGLFSGIGGWVTTVLPPGPLQSLLSNGVVAGVGAVFTFLPQILILFLFIAILEDCGYMARVAFLLDRWMSHLGLNGKSLIPLVSSFACAVPGIMAARTIEDRRGRLVTILIAPVMSCSARLPVYTLLIAAFVPATPLLGGLIGLQAVTMLSMYALGIVVAVGVAWLLNHTILRGTAEPFLMELPSYKWPTVRTIAYRLYEQGREFCVSAGTIIFAVTIVVWALGYYPHPQSIAREFAAAQTAAQQESLTPDALQARLAELHHLEAGAYLRQSMLGKMGLWIEPCVRPLGWDWRIGTAAIASFPAREVIIATLGTIYNLGEGQDESSGGLRHMLAGAKWPDGRPVYNLAVALSIMVFFALCCQCAATLAVIKRETNSWRWPAFTFAYMTILAYVGALVTYQVVSRVVGS